MEALVVVCGVFISGAFIWSARVLWYALSGQYEIDQRLNAIRK